MKHTKKFAAALMCGTILMAALPLSAVQAEETADPPAASEPVVMDAVITFKGAAAESSSDKVQIEGSRVQYFVEAVGSGFHMWPLKGSFKNRIGKHTISHGCIRLRKADAIWMFKNIKLKTTVQIF